jgi:hypothetical protein
MISTGALVVFSAPGVDAKQEAEWYGLYALALWLVVAAIVQTHGSDLMRRGASVERIPPDPRPG